MELDETEVEAGVYAAAELVEHVQADLGISDRVACDGRIWLVAGHCARGGVNAGTSNPN